MRDFFVRAMRRPRSAAVLALAVLAIFGLLLAKWGGLWALAVSVCNGDGVCSYEELSPKSSPANQPCPDCRSKTYGQLVVNPAELQIVTQGNDTTWSAYKILQFKSIGVEVVDGDTLGVYRDAWASLKTEDPTPSVCTGDADNDGQPELVAAVNSGKGKRINLYETGSTGGPSWQSPYFAKSAGDLRVVRVGDVDGDGRNELVMDIGDRVWIYRAVRSGSSVSFTFVWTSPSYGKMIWTMDIGDADDRGDNEIVLAVFANGGPIVLRYAGSGAWQSQAVEQLPNQTAVAIDVAKVRDVDDEPGNEILAGGNNSRVMVWKYDGTSYRLAAISDDLGGYTQGVDAGEFDPSLPGNEIVTAAASMTALNSTGYLLKLSGGAFQILSSVAVPGSTSFVCAKDLDADGLCEVGISIYRRGLDIYECVSGGLLLKRFSCVYGSLFESGRRP